MQNIRKVLNESNGYYKGTAELRPNSSRSIKKKTPEFAGEIHAFNGNDSGKSIRSMAMNMGFFVLWHINLCGLFNAKANLLEGQ